MGKRLFIALELPGDSRAKLAAVRAPVRGVRWLPENQLHLTLAFLGEVSGEAEERLCVALAGVRLPPFCVSVKGIGAFGGAHPSVIWAGVEAGQAPLFALHRQILRALQAAQFEPDPRPFHPHVTIARARNVTGRVLQPLLASHESVEFGQVEVAEFALFSSRPGPEGAVYTVERRYDLTIGTASCSAPATPGRRPDPLRAIESNDVST